MTVRRKRFLGCCPTPVRPDFSSFLVHAYSDRAAELKRSVLPCMWFFYGAADWCVYSLGRSHCWGVAERDKFLYLTSVCADNTTVFRDLKRVSSRRVLELDPSGRKVIEVGTEQVRVGLPAVGACKLGLASWKAASGHASVVCSACYGSADVRICSLLPEPGGTCHLGFGTVWRLCITSCLVLCAWGYCPAAVSDLELACNPGNTDTLRPWHRLSRWATAESFGGAKSLRRC